MDVPWPIESTPCPEGWPCVQGAPCEEANTHAHTHTNTHTHTHTFFFEEGLYHYKVSVLSTKESPQTTLKDTTYHPLTTPKGTARQMALQQTLTPRRVQGFLEQCMTPKASTNIRPKRSTTCTRAND